MDSTEDLERFGEFVIHQIRDRTLAQVLHSLESREHSPLLSKENDSYRDLVFRSVDTTLAFMLGSFEETADFAIVRSTDITAELDLIRQSDGLEGEFYGNSGWIVRYSEYKEEYLENQLKHILRVVVTNIARRNFGSLRWYTRDNVITPEAIQREMDSFQHEFSDFPIGQLDAMDWIPYTDGSGYSIIAPLWKSPMEKSDLSVIFHVTRQESGWTISIQDVHVL